jgi:hypothetical protein
MGGNGIQNGWIFEQVLRDIFESSLEYRIEDYIYLSSFSTVFHFHDDSEEA